MSQMNATCAIKHFIATTVGTDGRGLKGGRNRQPMHDRGRRCSCPCSWSSGWQALRLQALGWIKHLIGWVGRAGYLWVGKSKRRGIYFRRFFFFSAFGFLACWLLGFLASWLLDLLASWLLAFLASQLLGFSASWLWPFASSAFPVPLRAGGILAFAAFRWFMRLLVALAFCILCFPSSCPGFLAFAPFHLFFKCGFPHHQHHQFLPT